MKLVRLSIVSLFVLPFLLSLAENASAARAPGVVIIATGGTMARVKDKKTEEKYKAAVLPVDKLLAAVPELTKLASVRGEQVAQIGSQAMNNEVWLKLATRINKLLLERAVDGVVVTHGTDTMEETAYFLNLVVKSRKPVVLVGAMRATNSLSPDGPQNLFNAVAIAASPAARDKGVMIAMNDLIHGARDVTKTNTTMTSTFASPNFGPLGTVSDGKPVFFRTPTRKHTHRTRFDLKDVKKLPRVDIVYGHANNSRTFVDAAVAAGAKGIVHAGVGNGNLYPDTEKALVEASAKKITVVRSSRVGSGRVTPDVEVEDTKHGFVAADTLNPQKARILLMLSLLGKVDPTSIQKLFFTY